MSRVNDGAPFYPYIPMPSPALPFMDKPSATSPVISGTRARPQPSQI